MLPWGVFAATARGFPCAGSSVFAEDLALCARRHADPVSVFSGTFGQMFTYADVCVPIAGSAPASA